MLTKAQTVIQFMELYRVTKHINTPNQISNSSKATNLAAYRTFEKFTSSTLDRMSVEMRAIQPPWHLYNSFV